MSTVRIDTYHPQVGDIIAHRWMVGAEDDDATYKYQVDRPLPPLPYGTIVVTSTSGSQRGATRWVKVPGGKWTSLENVNFDLYDAHIMARLAAETVKIEYQPEVEQ